MRAEGVHVLSPDGDLHVRPHVIHLCEVAELTQPFDVVLMLMKAYDSPWATRLLAPYLRSEEHTSELQSLMRISYAVFCLKKTTRIHHHNHPPYNIQIRH